MKNSNCFFVLVLVLASNPKNVQKSMNFPFPTYKTNKNLLFPEL